MRKFLYDPTAVGELPERPGVSLLAGQPIVLDESMRPVKTLNDWLWTLPSRGCQSPATWSGYADDLVAWARFLRRLDLEPVDDVEALGRALSKYRELRLGGGEALDEEFGLLGPSAWNRAVAAMENFYDWALEQRLVTGKPFRYKSATVRRGSSEHAQLTQRNLAKARAGSGTATLRSLAPDWADMFVDVGLGGQLPSGAPDPSFRGRSAARNRALGALVRSSGLRRAEFSHLLVWELPRPAPDLDDPVGLNVPATIAKGSKARSTWASSRALDLVWDYIGLERDLAVSSSSWMPDRPLVVTEPDERSGRINGKRVAWSKLSIAHRRRLIGPEGGSGLLFVRSNGAPVDQRGWRDTFDSATARCQQFDSRFPHVTPHMLRHTFALETLNLLTKNSMIRAQRLARVSGADPIVMAVLRRNDALLILRDMLGHESVKTTEKYLRAQGVTGVFTDAELDLLEAEDQAASVGMDGVVAAS
ncbi:tyrosine-type recombinase/integrase [Cellulomonas hominis]